MELPAWVHLNSFAKKQIEHRRTQLELPEHERLVNEGRALPSDDYVKGEIQGLRLFCKIPEILIDEAKALIDQENKDGNGTTDSDGTGNAANG